MLDSFVKKKQSVGGIIKTLDKSAKIKRGLILDFLRKYVSEDVFHWFLYKNTSLMMKMINSLCYSSHRFSTQMSQYCVRAQIIAYYFSLSSILDDIPSVRQSHFMIGQASAPRVGVDAEVDLCPDPRTFQRRSQQLLSADGEILLNLWFIPHYSDVLHMFKTLHISACVRALHHTLEIASALHDIVYYLVSFSRLGNTGYSCSWRKGKHLAADWGGTEGIGAELLEIQRQVNGLSDPSSPQCVSRLLQLRRQVLFLQFDAAVRHLIR
ncbi:uncharacterized protein LOC143006168 [Genypterus blacodes]|uniref:uncharacterized protein LOC143006168 n=1 Tax=Genypterus blacodes TaxID=154954 RepID=UPI003F757316